MSIYYVSPYDSQRSHPSMDLGVKWDLCVLFVQTAVKCQDCKFVQANCTVYCSNKMLQRLAVTVFLGKTYVVSPYDSQRSHPLMNLGGTMYLCVLFVQTAVKCQDCKFV